MCCSIAACLRHPRCRVTRSRKLRLPLGAAQDTGPFPPRPRERSRRKGATVITPCPSEDCNTEEPRHKYVGVGSSSSHLSDARVVHEAYRTLAEVPEKPEVPHRAVYTLGARQGADRLRVPCDQQVAGCHLLRTFVGSGEAGRRRKGGRA